MGGKHELLDQAVASQHEQKYAFPSMGLDVVLSMQVPHLKAKDGTRMSADKSVGTNDPQFRGTGMAVWEGSFVLAEFLSRHSELQQVAEVKKLLGESSMRWDSWKGKIGVELGAGLGLPSIVASNLGAKMIATDGDDAVLQLLRTNTDCNAPSCRVKKLSWGSAEPLAMLKRKREPDFVLAADVVYGSDLEQWSALVKTIKGLSGSNTLVLIANVHRYPVGHPNSEGTDGAFYEALSKKFEVMPLSQSLPS